MINYTMLKVPSLCVGIRDPLINYKHCVHFRSHADLQHNDSGTVSIYRSLTATDIVILLRSVVVLRNTCMTVFIKKVFVTDC